jgi:hypothetical protein
MAIALVSHTQYSGQTPSIVLTGGSSSSDRVLIILSGDRGQEGVASSISLAANSLGMLGTALNEGGNECSFSAASMQNPGAGTYAGSFVWTSTTRQTFVWDVYEFSGAGTLDNFTASAIGGQAAVPYTLALAANCTSGDLVVFAAGVSDGVDGAGTSTITSNLALTSKLDRKNGSDHFATSGYRTTAGNNESLTWTFSNLNTTGGAVDRSTAVTVRVPVGALSPTLTTTDTLQPGAAFSLTYVNFTGVPTSPVAVSDGTTSINVPVTVSDNGSGGGTAPGTFPALTAQVTAGAGGAVKFGSVTVTLDV